MRPNSEPVVVVGVDGSPESLRAVELGAREAAYRKHGLMLARAIPWPFLDVPFGPDIGRIEHAEREQAEADILAATERARQVAPEIGVRSMIELTSPADLLLRIPGTAMIVVGVRSHLAAATPLAGSTATQVATHAICPVLIPRGHANPGGNIVVGIDDGTSSASAIAFAFEEAELRGCGLTAMHAWSHPMALGPADVMETVDQQRRRVEERILDTALAGWVEKHPDVAVERVISRGSAKSALADASCRSQLVVVGARGRGGFAGLLLGSVGLSLIRAAACPVAVVRPAAQASV